MNGASEQPAPTLGDVARAAGASRTAAAKVLLGTGGKSVRVGPRAAARITDAAARLHYTPNRAAQQLAGGATHTLGILTDTVNAPVMNDRLAEIEREARARGYRLLIGQIGGDEHVLKEYLDDFDGRRVDAIFCLFDLSRTRRGRLGPVLTGRRNVVFHGRPLDRGGYAVGVDTALAIRRLVDHLVAGGRTRPGLELWSTDDELMARRGAAFRAALTAHGLPTEPDRIWTAPEGPVSPSPATLDDAVSGLVVARRADAVIASNDIWGVRLIQALKRRGYRVPEDVAVTGYDNLDAGTMIEPALTTIDQDHRGYAIAAIDLLLAVAAGAAIAPARRTVTLAPRLIARASTLVGAAAFAPAPQ